MSSGGGSSGMPDGPDGTRGSRLAGVFKLLYPGVGVKRWLLVGAAGVCVWSIGAAFMLRKLFALPFPDFLPSYYEGILLLGVGIVVVSLAVYGLYRSIGPLVLVPNAMDGLASTIYTRRSRAGGPRVVAIGGGTGLSVLLRGLKAHTDNLTAVITVADDGGSSGRLRKELGVLPPGDFRNCLVALSEAEPLLTELFQYRFDQGNGLTGHSFGNLFLVAMSNVTHSFDRALLESSRVLAVHGQIVPATVADLSLSAILKDGSCVDGESDITQRGGDIDRLFIDPPGRPGLPHGRGRHRAGPDRRHRSGQPVYQRPPQSDGAGHLAGNRERRGHPRYMCATWLCSGVRPWGTPWQTTWRRCSVTRLPRRSTTFWRTSAAPGAPKGSKLTTWCTTVSRCATRSWCNSILRTPTIGVVTTPTSWRKPS